MLSAALIGLIRLYQRLSRAWPGVCRFRPTCSEYMIQAVQTHGLLRGLRLGLWRILRCNPFCRAGDDPVPPRDSRTNSGETDSLTE